jgi:hypothetical protein
VRQSPDPTLVSPVIIAFDPSKSTLEVESEQIKCSTDSCFISLKNKQLVQSGRSEHPIICLVLA